MVVARQDPANPVAALKVALRRAGVTGSLTEWRAGAASLQNPLEAIARQRDAWLLEAQRHADIQAVAAGRPKLKIAGKNIRWQWIAGQVCRLGLPDDQQAALFGVMAGDAVPETTAAKWNGGNECCKCGAKEDLLHRWWSCPRRQTMRSRALQGASRAVVEGLPLCTKTYGIPEELPEITSWRAALPADRQAVMPASTKYYVDGSCLRPRSPEVRIAAWAVVGRAAAAGGFLPGPALACRPLVVRSSMRSSKCCWVVPPASSSLTARACCASSLPSRTGS